MAAHARRAAKPVPDFHATARAVATAKEASRNAERVGILAGSVIMQTVAWSWTGTGVCPSVPRGARDMDSFARSSAAAALARGVLPKTTRLRKRIAVERVAVWPPNIVSAPWVARADGSLVDPADPMLAWEAWAAVRRHLGMAHWAAPRRARGTASRVGGGGLSVRRRAAACCDLQRL